MTREETERLVQTTPLMLFDGQCVFCNGAANFAFRNEQSGRLKFAALQSQAGQEIARLYGLPTEDFNTFVIINNGKAYTRFDAAVELGRLVGGGYAALAGIMAFLVPGAVGNSVYSFLWPMRKLFGAKEQCIIPSAEMKARVVG